MHQSLRMRETQVTAVLKTAQFKITLSFCRVFFMEVYLRPWCPILAICAESSDPAEPRDDAPCWHRLTPCLPNGKAGTCPPAGHGYFGCCCLFFLRIVLVLVPKKRKSLFLDVKLVCKPLFYPLFLLFLNILWFFCLLVFLLQCVSYRAEGLHCWLLRSLEAAFAGCIPSAAQRSRRSRCQLHCQQLARDAVPTCCSVSAAMASYRSSW